MSDTVNDRTGGSTSGPVSERASGTMAPPETGVKVRMYRQGLGDCFLLAFPGAGGPRYVMIDCGVILGTHDPETIMQKVAADIIDATGGHVDLLIITHEHWDHLSGFIQAGDLFNRLTIHNLWLAWTEDPTNELANTLRAERHRKLTALRMAVERADGSRSLAGVEELLGFFGEALGAAGRNNTQAALEYLRGRCQEASIRPRYCHPGEPPLPIPGIDPSKVRVFVLGPPEDEKRLKQSDPTAAGQEVYQAITGAGRSMRLDAETAFCLAAAESLQMDDLELFELSFPFDKRFRVPFDMAMNAADRGIDFFQKRYFGQEPQPASAPQPADVGAAQSSSSNTSPDAQPPGGSTVSSDTQPSNGGRAPNLDWRRIDGDWLGVAEELALKLDSDTNNTSLALAIEVTGSGQVLLFPGDAQVGNWLSWGDCNWTVEDGHGGQRTVNVDDLLGRTVFYKVGHHGSHNATLRARGLELMTHPALVAMVPIHEKTAHDIKHWNQMPFGPLLSRLAQKTQGRILRVDAGAPGAKPDNLSDMDWQDFLGRVAQTDLYIEYVLPEGEN